VVSEANPLENFRRASLWQAIKAAIENKIRTGRAVFVHSVLGEQDPHVTADPIPVSEWVDPSELQGTRRRTGAANQEIKKMRSSAARRTDHGDNLAVFHREVGYVHDSVLPDDFLEVLELDHVGRLPQK
jgi:hypothetical protein